ncbi:MAG: CatB-related O-acetyltransferase [Selenomonadaceae bacterium]|nr:CatB-related O-acetyltransferase [Selenomonadaceae bacterium]
MAYKTLLFGTDDLFETLKPYYLKAAKQGNLEIVATVKDSKKVNVNDFDLAIISSKNDFYRRMKLLEAQGFPRNRIIDGRVFKTPNLDFSRFLEEGIAYGTFDKDIFDADLRIIYPKVFKSKNGKVTLSLGKKSYIRSDSRFEGKGLIQLGNFSSFAKRIFFRLGQNHSHNYHNVGTVPSKSLDWEFPKDFWPSRGKCKIIIGNDVWCGHDCIFKCTNPNKPLTIGDGAVIASDSVVVKSVPPYAIVGGNPAQIIKYRFEPEIIESLLRIKWWDWSLDKIHDNFKYFNDVEKFISLHDRS